MDLVESFVEGHGEQVFLERLQLRFPRDRGGISYKG
jgi:hypothetical protein